MAHLEDEFHLTPAKVCLCPCEECVVNHKCICPDCYCADDEG